jgi:polysaccharide biosynthesis/export protein
MPMVAKVQNRMTMLIRSSNPLLGCWVWPIEDEMTHKAEHNARPAAPDVSAIRRTWPTLLNAAGVPLLLLGLITSPAAAAEYQLARGDVVEIGVSGAPELHRRIMIGDDGKIYIPMLGELGVVGRSTSELRTQIHNLLVAQHAFVNPEVTVDVAEYRPINVGGAIAKPGAYPFRPGMTVRDAIVLAGGYGRRDLTDPAEARDQYRALSITFVKLQIQIARFQAELGGKTELTLNRLDGHPIEAALVAQIRDLEAQQLKIDQDNYHRETAHLEKLIEQTNDQITALVAEQTHQQSVVAQKEGGVARAQALYQKSLVSVGRLEDEQRDIAKYKADLLEVQARVAQTRRDSEEYQNNLQKLANQMRSDTMQRLEASLTELGTIKLQLATAAEKAGYTEAEILGVGQLRGFIIFRKNHQDVVAERDTELLPGDTLEITLAPPSTPVALRSGE